LGWSWIGKTRTYTHHNTVAYNHIHHLGNGVLNDLGGIYTLGDSPGTVLHHNLIHDVTRFERGREGYGGWGVYLDAGSSRIRVENNVVYNTRDGGLHVHCYGYPFDDEIVNNIFAYSGAAQLIRDNNMEPDGTQFRLQRNIVVNDNPQMLGGGNWKPGGKFASDHNCFWNTAGTPPDFSGETFSAWQAAGRDRNSIVADPGFINPRQGDFGLRRDSPARAIGFQPIDISTAGLYGDPAWTQLPRGLPHRPIESQWRPACIRESSSTETGPPARRRRGSRPSASAGVISMPAPASARRMAAVPECFPTTNSVGACPTAAAENGS
jgi:hypothetical protein